MFLIYWTLYTVKKFHFRRKIYFLVDSKYATRYNRSK